MSFIETDKRHPIMWREKMTNQIRSNSIYVPQATEQNMSIAVAKKTPIDKRLFVGLQFITAVRQIEASSRVAEDNVNHFEVGK